MTKYIIVLRHGPTKNEVIDHEKFINLMSNLMNYIKHFFTKNNIDFNNMNINIYTSEFDRCFITGKIINSYLKIMQYDPVNKIEKEIKVIKKHNLRRWDKQGGEDREKSINRSYDYGIKLYNKNKEMVSEKDTLIIYVTHSSIIPSFICGLAGLNKYHYRKTKLTTASLTIINADTRVIEVFNKYHLHT
jgi:broad specificity phosphatase PhoE